MAFRVWPFPVDGKGTVEFSHTPRGSRLSFAAPAFKVLLGKSDCRTASGGHILCIIEGKCAVEREHGAPANQVEFLEHVFALQGLRRDLALAWCWRCASQRHSVSCPLERIAGDGFGVEPGVMQGVHIVDDFLQELLASQQVDGPFAGGGLRIFSLGDSVRFGRRCCIDVWRDCECHC